MRVAVTGGTGVVGREVVRHLSDAGHEVVALARSDRGAMVLQRMGASPRIGDVTDPESLTALVTEAQWVFNVAGVNELCPRDPSGMWEVNVNGALAVLDACERGGVERLIHTSSAVTIGAPGDSVATEMSQHRGWFVSEYERSKTVAERLLFDTATSVDVVSVNPSSVQGPGRATGTGRLLLAAARGRARLAVNAVLSIVDIADCARGHLLAAERGVKGERYLLSGSTIDVKDLVRVLNRLTTNTTRPVFLSPSRLELLAPWIGVLDRLIPGVGVCEESIRVLLEGHRYDGGKAVRDLGLEYTPLEDTLRRTIDWFGTEGLL